MKTNVLVRAILLIFPIFLVSCACECPKSGGSISGNLIKVDVSEQKLDLFKDNSLVKEYICSTSRYGVGFKSSSKKTPTGEFKIVNKIGDKLPINTNFKGRVPTKKSTGIVARILQLTGLEKPNRNTINRCVYIHGTRNIKNIGKPATIGCIVLAPADVIDLFAKVEIGTKVQITK